MSKSQYERHFKKWKFRKNLKSEEWKAVHHHVSKRKRNDKESDVYIDDILVPREKVRKETSRNSFVSIVEQCVQGNAALALQGNILILVTAFSAPSSAMPNGLLVCTPAASEVDTLQTDNLPWFRFESWLESQGNLPVNRNS